MDDVDMICHMEPLTKSFSLKVTGSSFTKVIDHDANMVIGEFELGGHSWAVNFSRKIWDSVSHIVFSFSLLTETTTAMALEVDFCLFDYKLGEYVGCAPNKKCSGTFTKRGDDSCTSVFKQRGTFEEAYLKDDCFTLRCLVRLVKPSCVKTRKKTVHVPVSNFYQSDIYQHSIQFWETGEGPDVAFKVSDEIITAHRIVLVARSPVFRAQFFSPMIDSKTDCIIKVEDIKPEVFKFMLHFMYTDSLPIQQELSPEMAQHLLVAADRYKLERLKLICEENLSVNLDLQTEADFI